MILAKGEPIEIKYVLRLIAQLSFNGKIKNDLISDKDILKLLKNKKVEDEVTDERLLKSALEQIEWNLKEDNLCETKKSETIGQQHIMISYNMASRELCLKIKEKLEACGFKIWIDVNDIHGSSLDSMARAIENSFCVLMCVTEKYRQSVNCQAEAQYAFRMNKKIIPLIMQSGYETVQGWLGIIMGDKIYINFIEFDFDECIEKIKHEIEISNFKSKTNQEENVLVPTNNKTKKSSEVEKWSETQVQNWFIENKINMKIYEHFSPINGELLVQIYDMKNSAPEFYYQTLKEMNNDLRSITLFSMFINKLFSNYSQI